MRYLSLTILLFLPVLSPGQDIVRENDILVQGYSRTIEGTKFWYNSAIPDIHNALLVRAVDGSQFAEWETEPVPETAPGSCVNFVWQTGLGANLGSARMDLSLDGEPLFSFFTERRKTWKYDKDGIELIFKTEYIDGAGDYFGFMFLRIPSELLDKGERKVIRVTGSGSNSQAWFMCFEQPIPTGLSFKAFPGVLKKNGNIVQPVSAQVIYFGKPATGKLKIDGIAVKEVSLDFGIQSYKLDYPVVDSEVDITVGIESPGINEEHKIRLRPPRRWRVNFVQHSHTDIGYTRPQTEILGEHLRFIDYALDYCDATDNYPDESRFRWTCEASFAVDDYIRSRPEKQVERLKKRVDEGRIEITGMYFNFDEMPDEQTYAASLQAVKRIKDAGFPVKAAMQDDVNGIGWCFADYFPPLGVKYLNMGTHGHRALIPFDKPTAFWWESPSGNRMLAFRAEHYMTGNTVFGIHSENFDYFEEKLMSYLQNLEDKGYPYDLIHIQHSGYLTDNAPPSTLSSEMVKMWNQKYEWPKLRTATISEFFEEIENNYGESLPVIRGAWPDWWTDGFASGAREGAVSRQAHVDLIAAQGALAMASLMGSELPEGIHGRIDEANKALLFYDEHTFGFSESVRSPFSEGTMEQRALKESYAWEAFRRTRQLGEEAMGLLQEYIPRQDAPILSVFNTLNWKRSGLVEIYIDHQVLPPGKNFRIMDSDGLEAQAQALGHRSDGTYWGIWASEVPAFGYKTYRIETEDNPQSDNNDTRGPFRDGTDDSIILENQWYRLVIDKRKAVINSLYDKELEIELVDRQSGLGLGKFIHEEIADRSEMEAYTLKNYTRNGLDEIWYEASENGNVWNTVRFKGESKTLTGPAGFEMEIRLFNQTKRIDLAYMLRKKSIIEPESIYLAFPFHLKGGEISFEVQGGVVRAGIDQVPGSANDWNTVQNFAKIDNGKEQVVISSQEIPLMQFGGINTGRYDAGAQPETNHIYGWPMNNYWTTNFNADQRGEFSFTYSITSGNGDLKKDASRFGWGTRIPLSARVLPSGKYNHGEGEASVININGDNLLLVNAQPLKNKPGSIFLQMREIEGENSSLSISLDNGVKQGMVEANALGEPIFEEKKEVSFKPYEVKFFIISK